VQGGRRPLLPPPLPRRRLAGTASASGRRHRHLLQMAMELYLPSVGGHHVEAPKRKGWLA
jgi:hypothetical protein